MLYEVITFGIPIGAEVDAQRIHRRFELEVIVVGQVDGSHPNHTRKMSLANQDRFASQVTRIDA